MNFLAHLYLAEASDEALIGNLLGDFVKGDPRGRYHPAITEGILFHRKVDSFADAHPVTGISRNRIGEERRRFAGVIVDMCYDHFLARFWHRFSTETLGAFVHKVYGVLQNNQALLPQRLKRILPLMVAEDWLGGYGDINRVGATLDRIAGRLTHGARFKGAIAEVRAHYGGLENDFLAFFPELIAFARCCAP